MIVKGCLGPPSPLCSHSLDPRSDPDVHQGCCSLGLVGAEPPTAYARGRNLSFPRVHVIWMPARCQGGGFPGNRQAGVAEEGWRDRWYSEAREGRGGKEGWEKALKQRGMKTCVINHLALGRPSLQGHDTQGWQGCPRDLRVRRRDGLGRGASDLPVGAGRPQGGAPIPVKGVF